MQEARQRASGCLLFASMAAVALVALVLRDPPSAVERGVLDARIVSLATVGFHAGP